MAKHTNIDQLHEVIKKLEKRLDLYQSSELPENHLLIYRQLMPNRHRATCPWNGHTYEYPAWSYSRYIPSNPHEHVFEKQLNIRIHTQSHGSLPVPGFKQMPKAAIIQDLKRLLNEAQSQLTFMVQDY